MAAEDPELFAMFHQIAAESRSIVGEHLDTLAGEAVLQATVRFHHPAHAAEWRDPSIDGDLEAVLGLIVRGLRA